MQNPLFLGEFMPRPLSTFPQPFGTMIGNSNSSPSYHRPALALHAMNVVAEWSILESFVSSLFVQMLGENPVPSAAVFGTIRGQLGQREAIKTVAVATLDQEKSDIVLASLGVYEAASSTRNKICHWVWGYSDQIPDAVLLADPVAMTIHNAEYKSYIEKRVVGKKLDQPVLPLKRIFAYYAEDFEEASSSIQHAIKVTSTAKLMLAFSNHHDNGRELFDELSNDPIIVKHLERVRKQRGSK